MNRSVLVAVLVALPLLMAPPHAAKAADEWQPISPDDLALKDNPKQPGADAMLLYREVSIDAKPSIVSNYFRIKVFTAAGVKEQADIEIQYDKSQESIQAVRARTIHPDGSIAEFQGKPFDKEIVKGSGIKYLAKTFTMPDVQPGSIIEYQYREQYDPDSYQNFYWTIQSNLFTRLARFSAKWDDSPGAPLFSFRTYAMPGGLLPQREKDRYVLEIHDLAGIEEEYLMPPATALKAAVDFYYRDYNEPSPETVDQYWKRIGKNWGDSVDHFIDKKKELAADLSQDVGSSDAPEIKLRKLYARVLKIRNLDMEDEKTQKEEKQEKIKPNNNVDDVLKHGYGHGSDINFLLIGLARAAGFEAADVRVASRGYRVFIPQRKAAYDLNSELVWVRAGSQEYYLDPASRFYPFGVLPWFETAANGVRLIKDGSEMITTPVPVNANATIVRRADLNVSSTLETSGKIQVDFSGQEAASLRLDNRDADEVGRKKVLGDEIKTWLPVGSTFEVSSIGGWEDVEQPIHVEGTATIPSYLSGAAQRILMPMEVFQIEEAGWFKSEKRVNEVDFSYPYERIDDLIVHPPAGYKIQALPTAQNINPGPISYEISATQQQDALEVKRHLVIKGIRYPKESYLALRNFFSAVRTDDNAQVMFQNSAARSN
jgi:uncharacterized protein DUF3857